jgi:hypothetical protein
MASLEITWGVSLCIFIKTYLSEEKFRLDWGSLRLELNMGRLLRMLVVRVLFNTTNKLFQLVKVLLVLLSICISLYDIFKNKFIFR